jgi:hypothetical protein
MDAAAAARVCKAQALARTTVAPDDSAQPLSAHELLQLGVKRCGPGQPGSLPDPGQYQPLLRFVRGSDMIDGGRIVLAGDQVPARLRRRHNEVELLRLYDKLLSAASEAYLRALLALADDLEREPANPRWAALARKIRARTDAAGCALGRLALTVIAGAGDEQIMHVDDDFVALLLALTDGPALLVDTGADRSPQAVRALIREYDPGWKAAHVTEPGAQQALLEAGSILVTRTEAHHRLRPAGEAVLLAGSLLLLLPWARHAGAAVGSNRVVLFAALSLADDGAVDYGDHSHILPYDLARRVHAYRLAAALMLEYADHAPAKHYPPPVGAAFARVRDAAARLTVTANAVGASHTVHGVLKASYGDAAAAAAAAAAAYDESVRVLGTKLAALAPADGA